MHETSADHSNFTFKTETMMIGPISLNKFASAWLPALLVSTSFDPAPSLAGAVTWHIAGVQLPVITCILGLLGVCLARPLARRQESNLGLPLFLVVSAIMLVVVEIWIIDSRPTALLTFVIAIGLGFSGYSLIEVAGEQVRALAERFAAKPGQAAPSTDRDDH